MLLALIETFLFYYNLLGVEYIKVVLKDGRMVGAVLIGETDLEVWLHGHMTTLMGHMTYTPESHDLWLYNIGDV